MNSSEIKSNKLRDDLERYYENKFPHLSWQKTEFAYFIIELLINIDAHYFQINKPLSILTTSHNVNDGIGDYINQADFTAWLNDVFYPFKNIRVKAISILDNSKFALAHKLMPDNVKKNGTVMIHSHHDLFELNEATDKGNIFLSYDVARQNIDDKRITKIIDSSELLINLAIYKHRDNDLNRLLDKVQIGTMMQSRGEYGPTTFQPYYAYHKGDKLEYKLYYETCMGAESWTTGLKFYTNLQSLCRDNVSDEEKSRLAQTLDNKNLTVFFAGTGLDGDNYTKNHGFAFGYIQVKQYSILFARLMIAKSEDKNDGTVLMVDLSHFDNISSNEDFMMQLGESGYKQIHLVNNQGKITSIIPVEDISDNESEQGEIGKVLTLIEFRGTSQADKNKIIALSNMVAGSGNSSFSEMLSSSRFPFIQPIRHVRKFYNSFINEISNSNIEYGELLKEYFLLNINCYVYNQDSFELDVQATKNNIDHLIKIVSNSETANNIMIAFAQYCTYLDKNRNAYDDFIEIISTFIVQKSLEIDHTILNTLITLIPPDTVISGFTLLHLCIEKNLSDIANQLIENFPAIINAKCMYKDYTPIMMAARYRQYSIVDKLLLSGASIHAIDKDNLTIVDHAIINKDIELNKLLFNRLMELNDKPEDFERLTHKLFLNQINLYLNEYLNNNPEKLLEDTRESFIKSHSVTLLRSTYSSSDKSKLSPSENIINLLLHNLDITKNIDEITSVLENYKDTEPGLFLAKKLLQADSFYKPSRT